MKIQRTDLVYDDGEIRNCSKNFYKLGWFYYFKKKCSYKEILSVVDFGELLQALSVTFEFILFIILFPVLPIIRSIVGWRKIVKENVEQNKKIN